MHRRSRQDGAQKRKVQLWIALALVAVVWRCVNKGDANKDRDAVFATRV